MDEPERIVSAFISMFLLIIGLSAISQYLTQALTRPKVVEVVRDEYGNVVKLVERYEQ